MNAVKIRRSRRILLEDMEWQIYGRLLQVFGHRRWIRLTYDRERLEIKHTLRKYERANYLLDRFVIALTEELEVRILDRAGHMGIFGSISRLQYFSTTPPDGFHQRVEFGFEFCPSRLPRLLTDFQNLQRTSFKSRTEE